MKINRNNYEIYFIDHYDGNLNDADTAELRIFLHENADLRKEFEAFEPIPITVDPDTKFPGKNELKKNLIKSYKGINENNYEDYFIANYEQDLNNDECKDLQEFIKRNASLENDFKKFALLKLVPQVNTVFPEKNKLKKHPFVILKSTTFYTIAVAASLLILFSIIWFADNNNHKRIISPLVSLNKIEVTSIQNHKQHHIITLAGQSNNSLIIEHLNITKEERNELAYKVSEMQKVPDNEVIAMNIFNFENDFLLLRPSEYLINIESREYGKELMANTTLEEKTFFGKLLSNASNSVKSIFNKGISEYKPDPAKKNTIWNLAKAGIEGYNFFTDNNLELLAATDENGEIIGYALLGDNIQYLKRTKK